jgi:hypothetical protein
MFMALVFVLTVNVDFGRRGIRNIIALMAGQTQPLLRVPARGNLSEHIPRFNKLL